MRRFWQRRQVGWWSGLGLLLLLVLARPVVATGPSYPGNLSVTTISCGANPHVRVSWDISTPDPANNSPIWFYQVFKWDGPRGAMRADVCNATCPGTSVRNFACCPGYPNATVYPYGGGTPHCDVNGHCSFEETLDFAGGPWYYAVIAVDRAGNLSQTPSVCNSPYVGGGGTCDLGGGCTPFPCFQCTYNGTSSCTTPGYCTPPPGACLDIGACVTGPTTTTTSTSTTSTTTTLVSACASPTVVAAGGGVVSGTTTGASTLQGTCGTSTGPEKVYQWTPSLSGTATIQTCGGTTNFDTALYMRASTCTTGTEVACNDDGPCACGSTCGGTWASKITPTVTAGTTYYIIVDGRSGASGNFTLTVTPPSASTTTSSSTSSSTTTSTSGGGATTSTTLNIPMTWKWNQTEVPTTNLGVCDAANKCGVKGIAVDSSNNVAVVGSINHVFDFGGGTTLTSSGFDDMFVAKYGSTGTLTWAHSYGEPSNDDNGEAVALDPSGNVFVTGEFKNTVNFGANSLSAAGGTLYDGFLAKYNSSGVAQWAKRFGNTSTDKSFAVATDSGGNAIISGFFNGAVDFVTPCPTLTAVGLGNVFVAKYDPSGACIWAKSLGTTGVPSNQIAIDGSDNIYITGTYSGTIDFSPYSTPTSSGLKDIYVAKLNSAGVVQWAKSAGVASADDQGIGIGLDGSGNVLLVGNAGGAINFGGTPSAYGGSYLAKLAADGTQAWIVPFSQTPGLTAVVGDAAGYITVAGTVNAKACFGGGTVCENSNSTDDVLIARFNSAGVNTWHQRIGGFAGSYGVDSAYGIAATSAGRIMVGGFYSTSNTNFGGGALPTPLAPAGFVAAFDP